MHTIVESFMIDFTLFCQNVSSFATRVACMHDIYGLTYKYVTEIDFLYHFHGGGCCYCLLRSIDVNWLSFYTDPLRVESNPQLNAKSHKYAIHILLREFEPSPIRTKISIQFHFDTTKSTHRDQHQQLVCK